MIFISFGFDYGFRPCLLDVQQMKSLFILALSLFCLGFLTMSAFSQETTIEFDPKMITGFAPGLTKYSSRWGFCFGGIEDFFTIENSGTWILHKFTLSGVELNPDWTDFEESLAQQDDLDIIHKDNSLTEGCGAEATQNEPQETKKMNRPRVKNNVTFQTTLVYPNDEVQDMLTNWHFTHQTSTDPVNVISIQANKELILYGLTPEQKEKTIDMFFCVNLDDVEQFGPEVVMDFIISPKADPTVAYTPRRGADGKSPLKWSNAEPLANKFEMKSTPVFEEDHFDPEKNSTIRSNSTGFYSFEFSLTNTRIALDRPLYVGYNTTRDQNYIFSQKDEDAKTVTCNVTWSPNQHAQVPITVPVRAALDRGKLFILFGVTSAQNDVNINSNSTHSPCQTDLTDMSTIPINSDVSITCGDLLMIDANDQVGFIQDLPTQFLVAPAEWDEIEEKSPWRANSLLSTAFPIVYRDDDDGDDKKKDRGVRDAVLIIFGVTFGALLVGFLITFISNMGTSSAPAAAEPTDNSGYQAVN